MSTQSLNKKISLKRKPGKPVEVSKDYYPSLYLHNLPLKDADVGEKHSAEVSLRLTGITKRTGEKSSFDFEVIDIKFK